MSKDNFIPLTSLCEHYEVEITVFHDLKEHGLIQLISIEESLYIPEESIKDLEKMLRLHQQLEINAAGIDTVFNLLQQLDELKKEKLWLENKLRIYEDF